MATVCSNCMENKCGDSSKTSPWKKVSHTGLERLDGILFLYALTLQDENTGKEKDGHCSCSCKHRNLPPFREKINNSTEERCFWKLQALATTLALNIKNASKNPLLPFNRSLKPLELADEAFSRSCKHLLSICAVEALFSSGLSERYWAVQPRVCLKWLTL